MVGGRARERELLSNSCYGYTIWSKNKSKKFSFAKEAKCFGLLLLLSKPKTTPFPLFFFFQNHRISSPQTNPMGLAFRTSSSSMTHYMSTPTPLLFHSCSLPQRFNLQSMAAKRVRSELQVKVNGALSTADSDSLFLDRQKALEAAMNDINSSFGKGSVTRLGSAGGALVYVLPYPFCFASFFLSVLGQ